MFFKCSLCILICEFTYLFLSLLKKCCSVILLYLLNLVMFISVLCSNIEVLFSFFCIYWVERNFFSLTVFGGNLLAGHVHSSIAMNRHVQSWQWIDSICLLTWGLHWASASPLETCDRNGIFLLLNKFGKMGKSDSRVSDTLLLASSFVLIIQTIGALLSSHSLQQLIPLVKNLFTKCKFTMVPTNTIIQIKNGKIL